MAQQQQATTTRNVVKYPSIEHVNITSSRDWQGTTEEEALNHEYYIEEKIDGSQLSFALAQDNTALQFYNKGKAIAPTNKTFYKATAMLQMLSQKCNPEFVYHGEAVCDKRHNVAQYERTPKYYFVLYDLSSSTTGEYYGPEVKRSEAERLGLECVQTLYHNQDPSLSPYSKCEELIEQIDAGVIKSMLGGKIEGVVLKHHNFVRNSKKVSTKLKLVTDEFKESHASSKGKRKKATPEEVLEDLGTCYATHARFHKAYQHLRDQEKLTNKPKDIHMISQELDEDFAREHLEEIKNYLWVEFGPTILAHAKTGFSDWYKELMENKTKVDTTDKE
jgi:hypothetical protein